MKNKVMVTCLIIIIIFFVIIATYFWYNYFLNFSSNGNLGGNSGLTELVVIKDENKIYATFEEGSDEPINIEAYKFNVFNHGNKATRYNLIFKELLPSQVNDGCTNKTLLRRDELNYQLSYNGTIISSGRLEELNNNILDSRIIDSNFSNSYELKVWLNSSSDNNEGKHFHYKIDLEVVKK